MRRFVFALSLVPSVLLAQHVGDAEAPAEEAATIKTLHDLKSICPKGSYAGKGIETHRKEFIAVMDQYFGDAHSMTIDGNGSFRGIKDSKFSDRFNALMPDFILGVKCLGVGESYIPRIGDLGRSTMGNKMRSSELWPATLSLLELEKALSQPALLWATIKNDERTLGVSIRDALNDPGNSYSVRSEGNIQQIERDMKIAFKKFDESLDQILKMAKNSTSPFKADLEKFAEHAGVYQRQLKEKMKMISVSPNFPSEKSVAKPRKLEI
jgi:hypothetical protein